MVHASSEAVSHCANCAASAGCLLCLKTGYAEPPQSASTLPPGVHCGSGAARQSPIVFFACGAKYDGAQAESSPAAVMPRSRLMGGCVEFGRTVEIAFWSISFCQ